MVVTMESESVAARARFLDLAQLAESVCAAMSAAAGRLGFAPGSIAIPDPAAARYRLERDPASGEDSLVGEWRDARGQKQGSLVFHSDGSFFAEYDVVRAHPTDARWFVEAVEAWGRAPHIAADPRLLPALI
jgi:hypothetical protein